MISVKKIISYSLICSLIFIQSPNINAAVPPSPSVSLSLKKVIEETLKNNTSIAVQKFTSKINEQAIFEKEANFDAVLGFGFKVGEQIRQAAGAFANPDKSRNQNYDWDFSVSQKFITGADYDLSFNSNRRLDEIF